MENIARLETNNDNRFNSIYGSTLTDSEKSTLIALSLDLLREKYRPGFVMKNPADVSDFLRLKLADVKNEIFGAIFLTNRNAIISTDDLFHGIIDTASVYPRVVVQRAMERNAAAVIFYHNHPSGEPEPSEADKKITSRLKEALSLVDTRVLDHLVVGGGEFVSFSERGYL